MKEKCLFIGGHFDGDRLEVEYKEKEIYRPIFVPFQAMPISEDDVIPTEEQMRKQHQRETYVREALAVDLEPHEVNPFKKTPPHLIVFYRFKGITMLEACKKLFSSYPSYEDRNRPNRKQR